MLRIGYVRLRDASAHDDTTALKAAGCQVVRAEEPGGDGQTLTSILEFIGAGDELVVTRLECLAPGARGLLDALDRLERRNAALVVLHPALTSRGESGRTLRAVLEAVAAIEPAGGARRRRPAAAADEIHALQRAGVGPVEIARRLGVSRMTVWRKLKAVEAAEA
ncbi:MAG: recombinase family protein [Phenylobacterium sp.]|uniref:recombinase family protein n=1 Tax=Phenylobacterium sp. TaxID=1871053 RepID=UPI001A571C49|nr:recombinase family protein [Phenylobacterium sp.]MBL8770650.1 recombinase family protein [Phenylobacterium sp.]